MRQAALYARVSTRNQEKEATIESQLSLVETYAKENGFEIAKKHRFIDEAVSGSRLSRRGLDRLRDCAKARAFEVVLCLEPERLARSLGIQQVVLEEMNRYGVDFIFLDQPELAKDAHGQFWLQMRGAVAEYERTLISDRMRRGRLHRLRQRQTVPTQAPYGYHYQPATHERQSYWNVVEKEAQIVCQLYSWYAEGKVTIGDLVCSLNEQAIPSPRKSLWSNATVGRLLRHPAYKGTAYYNRHQSDLSAIGLPRRSGRGHLSHPRYNERPADEWILCPVPAIVDESLWAKVQQQLKMNSQFAKRNAHRSYLLRGLLVCHVCGHTLQGRSQKNGHPRYVCPYGRKLCPPNIPKHTTSIRADLVEPITWESLQQLLDNPQRIEDAWAALHQQKPEPSNLLFLERRRKTLIKERNRLIDAYQADVLTLEELTLRNNLIADELLALEEQLQLVSQPSPLQISLQTFRQRIQLALRASDFQTRQDVIRLLIERIVVSDDTLSIDHIVPLFDSSRLYHTSRCACTGPVNCGAE